MLYNRGRSVQRFVSCPTQERKNQYGNDNPVKRQKDTPFSNFDKDDDWSNFEENIVDEFDIFWLLETEFQYKQIEDAMKQLDDDSREIIYLKFIEEKDNAEIADILQISGDNVRQKISRALKKLKSILWKN